MPFLFALIISSITALLASYIVSNLGYDSFISIAVVVTIFTLLAIGIFSRVNSNTTSQSSSPSKPNKPNKPQQKKDKPAPKAAPQKKAASDDADYETGQVKWFDSKKGFGFIQRDNGEEIFVHHRSIEDTGQGRRRLRDGQAVEFRVEETDKGLQAEDVQVLED